MDQDHESHVALDRARDFTEAERGNATAAGTGLAHGLQYARTAGLLQAGPSGRIGVY